MRKKPNRPLMGLGLGSSGPVDQPMFHKEANIKADLKIATICGNIIFRFGPNFEKIVRKLTLIAVTSFIRV